MLKTKIILILSEEQGECFHQDNGQCNNEENVPKQLGFCLNGEICMVSKIYSNSWGTAMMRLCRVSKTCPNIRSTDIMSIMYCVRNVPK